MNEAFQSAENSPAAPSGQGAVERAAQEGAMQSADAAPQVSAGDGSAGQTIRVVGSRTFLLQEGVWLDTRYDPQAMTVESVVFLSPEYYQLLATRPDLPAALALGEQVLVVVDGKAYQVVPGGEPGGPLNLPPVLATPQPAPQNTPTALPAIPTPGVTSQPTTQPGSAPSPQTGMCLSPLAVVVASAAVRFRSRSKKDSI